MGLREFAEKAKTKNIQDIVHDENLATMEKLKKIVGDNYFTNSHRAKGIYELMQENSAEIRNNSYMSSIFAKAIQDNCLSDFKRIVSTMGGKENLPDSVKNLMDGPQISDEHDR